MTSDILILLKKPVLEADYGTISAAIYKATTTAVISFDPGRSKTVLVKFDPSYDVPAEILDAVRASGHDAVMAGG